MIARLALGLGALGLLVTTLALRCRMGWHTYGWQFVGDSWNPDAYTRVCIRCGHG